MASDLAAVSAQNTELSEKVEAIPVLQKKLQVKPFNSGNRQGFT